LGLYQCCAYSYACFESAGSHVSIGPLHSCHTVGQSVLGQFVACNAQAAPTIITPTLFAIGFIVCPTAVGTTAKELATFK
jgi:hypothetical protein